MSAVDPVHVVLHKLESTRLGSWKCSACDWVGANFVTEAKAVKRFRDYHHQEYSHVGQVSYRRDDDLVNHPPHYTGHPKGIECIDVIEDAPTLCLGTAMKYIWRVSWGGKENDLQDLRKSVWYLEREIARREGKANDATAD